MWGIILIQIVKTNLYTIIYNINYALSVFDFERIVVFKRDSKNKKKKILIIIIAIKIK